LATAQFGDEIGREMQVIMTTDDDFETIGVFDDEPGLDHAVCKRRGIGGEYRGEGLIGLRGAY